MNTIKSQIDHFESRTLEQIELVEKCPVTGRRSIQHKVLYASILDSLSVVVFADEKCNRKRYTDFVREYAQWGLGDRVSIIHLLRFTEICPDAELSELKKWAQDWWGKSLGTSDPVRLEAKSVSISSDPELKVVQEYWPKGSDFKKPFGCLTPQHFQHYNLLYRARNALVHEFRDIGDALEWSDDLNPYYQEVKQIVDYESTNELKLVAEWKLVYPVRFYKTLCLNALQSLVEYLRNESIYPYRHYSYGSYWLEKLN